MELSRVEYTPAHLAAATASINALAGVSSQREPVNLSAASVNALLISYAIARDVAMLRPTMQAVGTPTMLPGQRVGTRDIPVIGWTEPTTIVAGTQNDAADVRASRRRAWHAITEQMFRVANSPPATSTPSRPTGAVVPIETYAATGGPVLLTDNVDRLLVPYMGDATQARGLALAPATALAAMAPLNQAAALERDWNAHATNAQTRAMWAGGGVVGLSWVFGRLVRGF